MQPATTVCSEPGLASVEALLGQLVHDLRQPLSNIQNCACYLEMVLRDSAPGPLLHLEMIGRQVEEADRLLRETLARLRLELAQLEAGANLERTNSITPGVR